jgi:hypothetical protein
MATKTINTVRDEIEQLVINKLNDLEDVIAEVYEVECWDACLDGYAWHETLRTVVDMYVTAIVHDRDWENKKFKQAIDISTELEKAKVKRNIEQLQEQLNSYRSN